MQPNPSHIDRRKFVLAMSSAVAAVGLARVSGQSEDSSIGAALLGQGEYQWRVVPRWGVLDEKTPVRDCHAMVQSADGRIFLFTNETNNNVIIYNRAGELLGTWGTEFPGAHGMTIALENGEEFLYLTDHDRHRVFKTTLEGKIVRTWDFPEASGKYQDSGQYKPTHVALAPDGGFIVADGYGLNWCHRYDAEGNYMLSFGGDDGESALQTAHGAWVDTRDSKNLVWVTSRAEGKLKRFTLEGKLVDVIDLPGAMPNFIVPYGDHTVIPHLRGNQGKPIPDAGEHGFLSIMDSEHKLSSNVGAAAPVYADGKLEPMAANSTVFTYPHGILIDDEGSIYVAQWNSGRTYPIKLERVSA